MQTLRYQIGAFQSPSFARINSHLVPVQQQQTVSDQFMPAKTQIQNPVLKFGIIITPRTVDEPVDKFNYPEFLIGRTSRIFSPQQRLAPALQEWYQPVLLLLSQANSARTKTERNEWLKQLNIVTINLIIALNSDPLTGLWNKAFFEQQLSAQVEDAKQKGEQVSLAIIGLNDFKAINESCGHPFGDQAIQIFSKVLKDNEPKGSAICRIGGDEFAILFSNDTTLDEASNSVETIKRDLKRTSVREGSLQVFLSGSFGLAEIKKPTTALNAYKSADYTLGDAKLLKQDTSLNGDIFNQLNQALQNRDFTEIKKLMSRPRNSLSAMTSL